MSLNKDLSLLLEFYKLNTNTNDKWLINNIFDAQDEFEHSIDDMCETPILKGIIKPEKLDHTCINFNKHVRFSSIDESKTISSPPTSRENMMSQTASCQRQPALTFKFATGEFERRARWNPIVKTKIIDLPTSS